MAIRHGTCRGQLRQLQSWRDREKERDWRNTQRGRQKGKQTDSKRDRETHSQRERVTDEREARERQAKDGDYSALACGKGSMQALCG